MAKQLFTLFCITFLAGISVGMIVIKFNPFEVTETIKFLFFASLFAFMWGLGTLAFFVLNLGTLDRWADSFRRGLFLSVLFLILVFFKREDIFSWYIGAVLGGIFIIGEVIIYRKLNKFRNDESQQNNY